MILKDLKQITVYGLIWILVHIRCNKKLFHETMEDI